MGPSNIKWWRQPLSGHCLLCSCNDSPFEATWGEWLNSEVLCSEKIPRCYTDTQGEQPSRGWRTLNKVGVGQEEESVLCFQTQHWQQAAAQCLYSPSHSLCCVPAGVGHTVLLQTSWLMWRKDLCKCIHPYVFSCLSYLLNPLVRLRQKEQELHS